MCLVDEAMDLVQGRHHVQVQDGKREDFAGPDLAVDEQVDGKREDDEVEEALVDCLAGAEERHLEVMPKLLGTPVLGGPLDALDFLAVGVGGPDIVDAAKLLDDRAVDSLSTVRAGRVECPSE